MQPELVRRQPLSRRSEHVWVGAALVPLGRGDNSPRAAVAESKGTYVVPRGARLDVLEVYCSKCRVRYGSRDAGLPCRPVVATAI